VAPRFRRDPGAAVAALSVTFRAWADGWSSTSSRKAVVKGWRLSGYIALAVGMSMAPRATSAFMTALAIGISGPLLARDRLTEAAAGDRLRLKSPSDPEHRTEKRRNRHAAPAREGTAIVCCA